MTGALWRMLRNAGTAEACKSMRESLQLLICRFCAPGSLGAGRLIMAASSCTVCLFKPKQKDGARTALIAAPTRVAGHSGRGISLI